MRAEGYQLCLPTPGPLLLEAPRNAERTSQHALQNKLIYFEEARSGRLTPRLTSPPSGRSLQMASGEGRLPCLVGHKNVRTTHRAGGRPSFRPTSSHLPHPAAEAERTQTSSLPDTCWFFSQFLSWPRGTKPMLTLLPPHPRALSQSEMKTLQGRE